jgi:ribosomal protein L7/L12
MTEGLSVALVVLTLILVVGAVMKFAGTARANRDKAAQARRFSPEARPGEWSLILDGAGAKKIQVIKELRDITGLGLAEAKDLVDRTPSSVLSGVDHQSASTAYRILADVGAAVRITEAAALPADPPAAVPGTFTIILDDAGPKKIHVIKEIRALNGSGLAEAKHLSEQVPSKILTGIDHPTAVAAHAVLTRAGATARIFAA